ncbi:uncharacterized protein BROUX77_007273 [Berkeleyomyces rouxiae]|uniref:uncharacterized protein n=1 Tax=Berkeleyomyces rouxiae TaxID=2035830 RepID=UPI003B822DEF
MECDDAPGSAQVARPAKDQPTISATDAHTEVDIEMVNTNDVQPETETDDAQQETPTSSSMELMIVDKPDEQIEKNEGSTPSNTPKENEKRGAATEKDRNLAMARKHIAGEMKKIELRAEAYLWLAEKIPEMCNEAVAMAKGDANVRKQAGHVSQEFRAMLQKLQGGTTPAPSGNPKNDKQGSAKAPKPTPGYTNNNNNNRSYASTAAEADGGKGQAVTLKKKTAPKPKTKTTTTEEEKKVRVFVRGPAAANEADASNEIAKVLGGKPAEIQIKKVNSGWAFYTTKGAVSAEKLNCVKEACGAKACEIDKRWTHARITGLSDFYIVGENGPVTKKNEEWFIGQITEQTGGEVKSIKWQFETEKYMDATLRIAVDLPEGQTLPNSVKFEGSSNPATVKKCRTPSLPLCRTCWATHPTAGCKEKPRCRLCGSADHREGQHAGSRAACIVCKAPDHSAGDPACKRGTRPNRTTPKPTENTPANPQDDNQARKRKRLSPAEQPTPRPEVIRERSQRDEC